MLDKTTIKKILILRYRFIGDTVLTVPLIKNLRKSFPGSQIDILVSPNSGELLEGNPDLNNIFYFGNSKFHKYEKQDVNGKLLTPQEQKIFKSFFKCASFLKQNNYDLVFVLKRSFSSALLAWLSGAKHRIGFNTELRSFLLTDAVKYEKDIHELDNYLNCLRAIGIEPYRHSPEIFPTDFEKSKANGFLLRLDRFKPKVLIHATSAHPYKQWPKRYFAILMDQLFEQYEAQFVFTGTKSDKSVYEDIMKLCEKRKKIKTLDLCGLTNLRECYSVYKGLDLAVSVDSGNAHLAAATGIPTYVLFGPTRPEKWLPVGRSVFPLRLNQLLPCQPCDVKIQCSHLSCMKLLTPQFVFDNLANNKLIERKKLITN